MNDNVSPTIRRALAALDYDPDRIDVETAAGRSKAIGNRKSLSRDAPDMPPTPIMDDHSH